MTEMMSAILRLAVLMSFMVSTTWLTTSPPCTATREALVASWLACWADSAFWLTVAPSSLMDAEVCSRAPACCSVRADKSWLPWAISALAIATASALALTLCTIPEKLVCMRAMVSSRCTDSSLPWATICIDKSPAAMWSATATALVMGLAMRRDSHSATRIRPMAPPTRHIATIQIACEICE
jgi:hypothetical protein